MVSKVEKVVEVFKNSLDCDNEYTAKELVKYLEDAYKEVYGKGKKKVSSDKPVEKKPPSAYNIFIKEEIAKIKAEGLPDVDPKDFMKIAAGRWKEHKEAISKGG